MSADDVCAVIVSYHPDDAVVDNLKLLRLQLARVIVIDNGSSDLSLGMLRAASQTIGFELIENADNPGDAVALNQGIRHARDLGAGYVLFLDQQSAVTEGYVAAMLDYLRESSSPKSLAILVPGVVLSSGVSRTPPAHHTTAQPPASSSSGKALEVATISGSLMPTDIFSVAGFFAEELYLDGIDTEYSLRVRRLGFTIEQCSQATLRQEAGHPVSRRLMGLGRLHSANVSPIRRYYQERSKIWLAKHYGRSFPGFCFQQFVTSAKDLAKILLIERDKLGKSQFFLEGVVDGLRGVTGKKRVSY